MIFHSVIDVIPGDTVKEYKIPDDVIGEIELLVKDYLLKTLPDVVPVVAFRVDIQGTVIVRVDQEGTKNAQPGKSPAVE
jgi:hypothetical protein